MDDAPEHIEFSLQEALRLLSALEDVRDFLSDLIRRLPLRVEDAMSPLVAVEYQMSLIRSRLGIGGDLDDH